ncbi:protein of unknown function [Rhodovastum atsumiense]|nr:protein of unknown function [Rhodovastum atsumiense]
MSLTIRSVGTESSVIAVAASFSAVAWYSAMPPARRTTRNIAPKAVKSRVTIVMRENLAWRGAALSGGDADRRRARGGAERLRAKDQPKYFAMSLNTISSIFIRK